MNKEPPNGRAPTKSRKRQSINIRMTPETRRKLKTIADANEESQAQTVRRLIVHSYNMIEEGVPTCASGQRCLVPAMWGGPAPAKAPATHHGGPPANADELRL